MSAEKRHDAKNKVAYLDRSTAERRATPGGLRVYLCDRCATRAGYPVYHIGHAPGTKKEAYAPRRKAASPS